MSVVVLDSEAMWSLTRRPGVDPRGALAVLTAARDNNWDVVVPAAVLAELYRGQRQQQAIDAALGAHRDITVAVTDRRLARNIGGLLAQTNMSSEHHVDATVVAVALAAGGGLVVTGDLDDIQMLAAHAPGVAVEALFP